MIWTWICSKCNQGGRSYIKHYKVLKHIRVHYRNCHKGETVLKATLIRSDGFRKEIEEIIEEDIGNGRNISREIQTKTV